MKERPILFSAPMVRAILDGSKTQTRRIVKPQFTHEDGDLYDKIRGPELYEPVVYDKDGEMVPGKEIFGIYTDDGEWGTACPYGRPGDRLWVREAFRQAYPKTSFSEGIVYRADSVKALGMDEYSDRHKWKPSIHMPRWASRILLEITNVSIERLNDISDGDVGREGVTWNEPLQFGRDTSKGNSPAQRAFSSLWESINGEGSWKANPWVWVIEFKIANPT